MYSPLKQYQNNQVLTASPEKILIMLYDGAINFTRIARERIVTKDVQGRGIYIGKALAIVTELMNTLNHEVGGEVASRLEQLYLYLMDEYTKANISWETVHLDNADKILTILRDTWKEAAEIVQRERSASLNEQHISRMAG